MSFRFGRGDADNSDAVSALLSQARASRNISMEPPVHRGVASYLSSRSVGGTDEVSSRLSSLTGAAGFGALDGLTEAQKENLLLRLLSGTSASSTQATAAAASNAASARGEADVLRLLAHHHHHHHPAGLGYASMLGAAPAAASRNDSTSTLRTLLGLGGNPASAVSWDSNNESSRSRASELFLQTNVMNGGRSSNFGAAVSNEHNQAALELEILRLRAGLVSASGSSATSNSQTAASLANDIMIEEAIQRHAAAAAAANSQHHHHHHQATTAAGRRLSMLMQQTGGGSGRALGSSGHALGPGHVVASTNSASAQDNTTAAAAMLARSLVPQDNNIASLARSTGSPDFSSLVRSLQQQLGQSNPPPAASVAAVAAPSSGLAPNDRDPTHQLALLENLAKPNTTILKLPPVEEGNTPHYSQRLIVPLGIEEDPNWLSERQCFIRSELLEVVRASHEEVLVRSSSKSIAYQQVGIRCRFCAHMQPGSRAIRASAFPSSIRQMYQSFTMMVRDHFGTCTGVPQDKKQRFLKLKGLSSPSSSLSRQYWTFAAKKLGMIDSEYGIMISEESQAAAANIPPFGTSPEETAAIKAAAVEPLVEEADRNSISTYLFTLMQQAQVVHLLPSERVGKRKDAAVGLTGFGCRHCADAGRLGFCRMFPLNKRSLPDKVNDLYNHMIRCPQLPRATKQLLESCQHEAENNRTYAERDRDFIDRIWIKLGRDCDEAFKKS